MVSIGEKEPATAMMDGTFDPLHGGHIGQLLRAHVVHPFERAFILVNKHPVHKPRASALHHRVQMARLAMAEVRDLPFDYEIVATHSTLDFDTQNPIDYKVTGPDSIISDLADSARHPFLTRWRIIALAFPGVACQELEASIAAVGGELRESMRYELVEESDVPLMNYNFDTDTVVTSLVHSTDIRTGSHSSLVPASVHEYIRDNRLYGRE